MISQVFQCALPVAIKKNLAFNGEVSNIIILIKLITCREQAQVPEQECLVTE